MIQQLVKSTRSQVRITAILTTLLLCSAGSNAGQLTVGDWDFTGLSCFPGKTLGWQFEAYAGEGITIIDIVIWDLSEDYMQYDVVYEGEGLLTCSLNNCELAGDEGAQFVCDMPNEIFNQYLPTVVVEMPTTFCGFCDGWEPHYEFSLQEIYPNPTAADAEIVFELAEQSNIRLELHSLPATRLSTLLEGVQVSGEHQVSFNTDGTYPLGWYNLLLIVAGDTLSNGFCILNHPDQVSAYPPLRTTDADGRFFIPIEQLPLGAGCTQYDINGNSLGPLNASVALVLQLEGYGDVACNFQLDSLSVERPVFLMTAE